MQNTPQSNLRGRICAQVMQQQGGAEALAGLAPQLAQFAALIPEERRAIVLQPLVAVLRGIASWRVRIELTGQLSELARCLPVQVRPLLLIMQHPACHACAQTTLQMTSRYSILSRSSRKGIRHSTWEC